MLSTALSLSLLLHHLSWLMPSTALSPPLLKTHPKMSGSRLGHPPSHRQTCTAMATTALRSRSRLLLVILAAMPAAALPLPQTTSATLTCWGRGELLTLKQSPSSSLLRTTRWVQANLLIPRRCPSSSLFWTIASISSIASTISTDRHTRDTCISSTAIRDRIDTCTSRTESSRTDSSRTDSSSTDMRRTDSSIGKTGVSPARI